jgi:polyferredoxin
MIFTSLSERIVLPGLLFSFSMLVLTIILGRFFCGWICPMGTMVDMAGLPRRKSRGKRQHKKLRWVKFYLLAAFFVLALAGFQAAWFLDPVVAAARFVSLNLIPAVTSGIDAIFVSLIKTLRLYGPVYDFYRGLKSTILGINVYYFAHSPVIFLFFALIMSLTFIFSRFWCRALCPLGALYALAARFSLLRRYVTDCSQCGKCRADCRMGAINSDFSYDASECILCMDCVYGCPSKATLFRIGHPGGEAGKGGVDRRQFLLLLSSSFLLLQGFKFKNIRANASSKVIRPPAALPEADFVDRCVRCGNCMKVCITNGLQPCVFEAGAEGIWTPRLVPEIGYCEYSCTLCGNTCPTGAIKKVNLIEKHDARLGLAVIDQTLCLPWAHQQQCIVCQEHCPVAQKAIGLYEENVNGMVLHKPYIDPELCVGCGICQNKCPVRPVRAVIVKPL